MEGPFPPYWLVPCNSKWPKLGELILILFLAVASVKLKLWLPILVRMRLHGGKHGPYRYHSRVFIPRASVENRAGNFDLMARTPTRFPILHQMALSSWAWNQRMVSLFRQLVYQSLLLLRTQMSWVTCHDSSYSSASQSWFHMGSSWGTLKKKNPSVQAGWETCVCQNIWRGNLGTGM